MRGLVFAGGAIALGAVLLLALAGRDEAAPRPTPPASASSPLPRRGPEAASAPREPAALPHAEPAPPHAAATATARGLEARDTRLARAAGLRPGGETRAARLLRSYSAEELALLARFEVLERPASAPALEELVQRRRGGASATALREAATRLFAGDPLARAAALEWVRTAGAPGGAQAGVAEPGPAEPR